MISDVSFSSQNSGVPRGCLPGLFPLGCPERHTGTGSLAVPIRIWVLHKRYCQRKAIEPWPRSCHCSTLWKESLTKTLESKETLTWVFSPSSVNNSFASGMAYRRASLIPYRESEEIKGLEWEKVNFMGLSKMMEILLSTDSFIVRGPRVFQERWMTSAWWGWISRTFQYRGWAHDSDIAGFSQYSVFYDTWSLWAINLAFLCLS